MELVLFGQRLCLFPWQGYTKAAGVSQGFVPGECEADNTDGLFSLPFVLLLDNWDITAPLKRPLNLSAEHLQVASAGLDIPAKF